MLADHYETLGVHPHADQAEVRAAYLRLMRTYHPDRRPDDPRAAEQARTVNAAWEVLGDRERRASYDRLRAGGTRQPPRPVSPPAGPPAYSPERARYQQAFHLACLKVAIGLTALGFLVLILAAG